MALVACRLNHCFHVMSVFLLIPFAHKFNYINFQIIKNIDLEELRELGSGTFGTVYHGKWRGTDVAIKRINDRCFAGKPSEQERMVWLFIFSLQFPISPY